MSKIPQVENHLRSLREERGFSAARVAAAAGVSRQTIYAIEAGTYVPNTVLALRLAQVLESSVEQLFRLATPGTAERQKPAVLVDGEVPVRGQPVQLARVGKRLIASMPSAEPWFLPPADAVAIETSSRGKVDLKMLRPEVELTNRIVIAGCDPGTSILARHARRAGLDMLLIHRNSSASLELLKRGMVHMAGTHLRDPESGESNLPAVGRVFGKDSVAVVTFASWEVGLITAPGNPKDLKGTGDLVRQGVRFVNREPGAGVRLLLDTQISKGGIDPQGIQGYGVYARGHLHAASQVAAGLVDCCMATRAAAQRFGLSFTALVSERYDLVLRRADLGARRFESLLDITTHSGFRNELAALGYETASSGSRVL